MRNILTLCEDLENQLFHNSDSLDLKRQLGMLYIEVACQEGCVARLCRGLDFLSLYKQYNPNDKEVVSLLRIGTLTCHHLLQYLSAKIVLDRNDLLTCLPKGGSCC